MDIYNKFISKLPVSINNYYGDPVIQWGNTLWKIKKLSKDKHKGPVGIITKGYITRDMAKDLKDVSKGLNLLVLESISGLPEEIEPISTKKRYETLKNLTLEGIPSIGYIRPLIPPYNTSKDKIESVFKNISETGCKNIVISGFRGDDDIIKKTNPENKKQWVVRVKIMPKGMNKFIEEFADKYNLDVATRTSCGVAKALNLKRSFNPYYNSPNGAKCGDCRLKDSCYHLPPDKESLEFIKMLGYDIEYKPLGKEKCKVTADNRLSCPSCCTSCFVLDVPHILVKNQDVKLGDLAFIRFITGTLTTKPGVVDGGKPDVGHVNFPNIKMPSREIHCINTWFPWARNLPRCFNCSYCITTIFDLEEQEYGMRPKKLAEYISEQIKEVYTCNMDVQ